MTTFVTLVLLDVGITLLYAAYKNQSPIVIIQEFITGKKPDEPTEQ